ncbi:MAG TPA: enolase C-terminal domain-like protein, partial [Thermosynergistes sp.]|nr:enolase C-terminal domain-like protein [Thermosynergistes sp.]
EIGWFEEPVPPEDIQGYIEVKDALSVPIAGGECEYTRFGFRELLSKRAVDIVQPDTCSAGGLSECKKIAAMASAWGVRYLPHVWGSGVALAANLHLIATIQPASMSANPIEPIFEYDTTENPFRTELLLEPIIPQNGSLKIPQGPGLGIDVDRKVLNRYSCK